MLYALSSVKQPESNGLSSLINYLWIVNKFRIDRFISSPMHCIFINIIFYYHYYYYYYYEDSVMFTEMQYNKYNVNTTKVVSHNILFCFCYCFCNKFEI